MTAVIQVRPALGLTDGALRSNRVSGKELSIWLRVTAGVGLSP
jgi:hypothetical protein